MDIDMAILETIYPEVEFAITKLLPRNHKLNKQWMGTLARQGHD